MNVEHEDRVGDVAIVGGGAAGLSAALTLARARRRVIVIDRGHPRNAHAAAAHGLLGLEGVNPLQLLAQGREEASSYGAQIAQAGVVNAASTVGSGFTVQLVDGSVVQAGQVLIATGVRDELPAVPGLADRCRRLSAGRGTDERRDAGRSDALAVPALTYARLDEASGLELEVSENAAGVAVVADAAGHTSVPGVWAAGNVSNPGMQVSEAAANGARVAMTINTELVFANVDQAVTRAGAVRGE